MGDDGFAEERKWFEKWLLKQFKKTPAWRMNMKGEAYWDETINAMFMSFCAGWTLFSVNQHLNEITVDELSSMKKTAEITAIEKKAYERGVQDSWDAVNKWIIPGNLPGNEMDKAAQRNGMVLASNAISGLMVVNGMEFERVKETPCQEV